MTWLHWFALGEWIAICALGLWMLVLDTRAQEWKTRAERYRRDYGALEEKIAYYRRRVDRPKYLIDGGDYASSSTGAKRPLCSGTNPDG